MDTIHSQKQITYLHGLASSLRHAYKYTKHTELEYLRDVV